VRHAAETATPAVVEGAAEEAEDKSTRDALATVLEDEEIRESTTKLARAMSEGAVSGVRGEVERADIERLTDAITRSVGASLAESIATDVAPRVSVAIGQMVDKSLDRALDEQTERRLQAMVGSVVHAALTGTGEAVSTVAARDNRAFREAFVQLTRDVAYGGALGLDDAVRDAQLQPNADSGSSVLAGLGTLARWARLLPPAVLSSAAILGAGLLVALAWALLALRRERRQLRAQTDRMRSYVQSTSAVGPS
jgi:hypothetical protein